MYSVNLFLPASWKLEGEESFSLSLSSRLCLSLSLSPLLCADEWISPFRDMGVGVQDIKKKYILKKKKTKKQPMAYFQVTFLYFVNIYD